jgi:large subunit ribosomal protein L15
MASSNSLRHLARPRLLRLSRLGNESSQIVEKHSRRALATSASRCSEIDIDPESQPRWASTPKAMIAPVRTRPVRPNNIYHVNSDPKKLDEVYVRILGSDGDKLLTDETKWLAVTHRSFDHGRRGFNDRLAFLGKRIIDMQASFALLDMPSPNEIPGEQSFKPRPDKFGRIPFTHPSLRGLQNLSQANKNAVVDKSRLGPLGKDYGLGQVVRWKPRLVSSTIW